ncbi:MAG: glucosyltransferase domain-containing protein, partial [Lachnospiraceae bacterium]|nr:glucosyltransferase domain-containing protein [Lachnospiraceae bacterium]
MFQKAIGNVKKEQITAAVSAGIFYCLTNGYRFFHTSFSGDALLMIHQSDAAWQIALGRFMQPFLVLLRGGITAPFLISVLALLWIALATALTATILELKHPISLILTGGVMAVTPAFIAMNAGFLLCVDMYAFALFLAVLSVWCFRKRTVPSLMGGIGALIGSIGIYQAFVCVTVGLLMLLLMADLREEEEYKDVPRRMGRYLLGGILSAALYYGIWKLIQKALGIWTADTYNGMASVGDYNGTSVFGLIGLTYGKVWNFLIHPDMYVTVVFRNVDLSSVLSGILGRLNVAALLIVIALLIIGNVKQFRGVWNLVLQVLLILLFPLGINLVCFISKGMEHTLMTFAFCLIFIAEIKCVEAVVLVRGGEKEKDK